MKSVSFIALTLVSILLISCGDKKNDYDASGAFESIETIVSTEAAGTILQLNVEEGQTINAGVMVGYIDSTQLYLKKEQLQAQVGATISQQPDIPVQVAALQEQLKEAEKNRNRFQNLVKDNAATQLQLDEAMTAVDVIKRQIEAMKSTLGISSATINKNIPPIQRQIDQINDQLAKCRVINPIRGTVLTKYAEAHEVVSPGKALYKIAETDTLILRAYITGSQLTNVKVNQTIKVRTDAGEKKYRDYTGIIYWISDKSEFTPKTIPTKDERADLVYAIKVRVVNDGYLKIGMYGEIKLGITN